MAIKDQTIILRMFAGLRASVGTMVPLTTLLLNWPPSRANADLADAVEGLAADGLLQPNENGTAYALTALGALQSPGR